MADGRAEIGLKTAAGPSGPMSPYELPPDLPVPIDDGAAGHLWGARLPRASLRSTAGPQVDLSEVTGDRAVVFFYPRTGIPGQPPGLGFRGEEWDSIPGARGCTPQSCGFRDLYREYAALGVEVFGVSTSTTDHQQEFVKRNHVPFRMLSDADLGLTRLVRLPTFEFPIESGGPTTLIARMAWYVERAVIHKVWYPVFPPDRSAATVLEWLRRRGRIAIDEIGPGDLGYVRGEVSKHWHSTTIWSIGREYKADALPGFVARVHGRPAGLITLSFDHPEQACEIVTLSAGDENRGVGGSLVAAAIDAARSRGCRRVFLTTSNDNLRALGFYQRRGFRLVTVHRRMMDRYRGMEKAIPRIGMNGIPLRDEIELEYLLR